MWFEQQVRPAPAVPEDIQQQFDALQHLLYVLRRAHLTGHVDEPVKALASTSLVDMLDLTFEDPFIVSVGIGPWLQYMEVTNDLTPCLLRTPAAQKRPVLGL